MSDYKHKLTFSDGQAVWLFGEDYFRDKRVFYVSHCDQLKGVIEIIERTGYPVVIDDLQLNVQQIIENAAEMQEWFTRTGQPMEFK